ncbi:MAG: DUF29 domain-containing protein [Rhodospirillaceae bacterium]
MHGAISYETDYYAWTQDQARRLREAAALGANLPLDFETLAEEVESMGRSSARAVVSALTRIIEHLLKLEYSPAVAPRDGWEDSVNIHRDHAQRELADSPSLYGRIDLPGAYLRALTFASRGLARDGTPLCGLPTTCPYSFEQILDIDWWPINRHGLE